MRLTTDKMHVKCRDCLFCAFFFVLILECGHVLVHQEKLSGLEPEKHLLVGDLHRCLLESRGV